MVAVMWGYVEDYLSTTKEIIDYHLDLKACPSGDVIKMVWLPFQI